MSHENPYAGKFFKALYKKASLTQVIRENKIFWSNRNDKRRLVTSLDSCLKLNCATLYTSSEYFSVAEN